QRSSPTLLPLGRVTLGSSRRSASIGTGRRVRGARRRGAMGSGAKLGGSSQLRPARFPGQMSRIEVAVVGGPASLHAKVCRAVAHAGFALSADLLDSAAAPESAQVSASDVVLVSGENGEGIRVAMRLAASVVSVPVVVV